MTLAVRSRVPPSVLIANVAIPTVLIVLILLVGGLITGGVVFALVYLYRHIARNSDEHSHR